MPAWNLIMLAAFAGLPAAELQTLKGDAHQGQLVELTATNVVLRNGDTNVKLPIAEVLEIRLPESKSSELPLAGGARVALRDGTQLLGTRYSVAGNQATLETAHYGRLSLPLNAVASVRFGAPSQKLDAAWDGLVQRDAKKDLLVIKKGDVLDQLAGVVGNIDAAPNAKVKLLLDGDEIPVNLEKVYGIIYARPAASAAKGTCQIAMSNSDQLQVQQITWNGTALQAKLVAGPEITLPLERVRALDFSSGKVRYLSQLEPREVKYVPFFDITWTYHRDRNLDGGPLRLGGKTYRRGLALHSRTLLRYRIGGEYGRFQAVMGIDEVVDRQGDVHVVISGDGKVLHESDVRGVDPPKPLDLDVTGVRDLDILVDFGGDLDIADHLDLADAKLVK